MERIATWYLVVAILLIEDERCGSDVQMCAGGSCAGVRVGPFESALVPI